MIKRINKKCIENNFQIIYNLNLETYKNVHQHIKVKCLKCGHEYEKRINDILHDYGCCNCVNLKRKSPMEFKECIKNITNGEYELLNDVKRTRDIGIFRHNHQNCKNPNKIFEKKNS